MMPVSGFIGKFQPFLGELEPSDLANGVFRWVRRTEGTPANMLPAFVRFQAKRIDSSLPGRHITDCQTRLYMKSRRTNVPAIAAAKAGFSTADRLSD